MSAKAKVQRYIFPIREVNGEIWCSLANMGIKRINVVAYNIDQKEKYSFAGGHRHRYVAARDDVHLQLPPDKQEILVDITNVKTEKERPPRRQGRQA